MVSAGVVRHPLRAPHRAVNGIHFAIKDRYIWDGRAKAGEEFFADKMTLANDTANPSHWNFLGKLVFAAQLGTDQEHESNKVMGRLLQHSLRHAIALLGKLANGRRQSRKVRARRAVAKVHQFVDG